MSETRILTEADCREIFERVKALARGGGETSVSISSWWQGELRWARNRVSLSSDRRDLRISVVRTLERGRRRGVTTNQLDDHSLEAAVRAAERMSKLDHSPGRGFGFEPPQQKYPMPDSAPVWSPATFGASTLERGEVARSMIAPAETAGLYSAGYLEVRAASRMVLNTEVTDPQPGDGEYTESSYVRWTQAQCSTTVRDASGTGSGWAGLSSYDWDRVHDEAGALAERAVQKCKASRNPVALEPGRYTVILEPQAVADLMAFFVASLQRNRAESGAGPWKLAIDDALTTDPSKPFWHTKLGLKVVDERITISHDPMDPWQSIIMPRFDEPGPVTWIERGVLKNLNYPELSTGLELGRRHSLRGAVGYRISSGDTSMEEMIRSTRRGLLVTRFSNLKLLDEDSLLTTGLTRDGLWLIENGEITKAVKNFRFTESPLFVLNNVEQIGEAVPVFRPTKEEDGELTPAIVPPIKARDFSFTSLIDAV